MANNFSGDSNCKALWRFESGALTTDSIGSNTLTDNNTVGTETVDYQEGAACALFASSNSEYFSRANASLSSGFPIKSGDSAKKCSVCFWLRRDAANDFQVYYSIYTTSPAARVFQIASSASSSSTGINIIIGHNNGTNFEALTLAGGQLTISQWYHLGVVFDGVAKTGKLRLWNGSTATNYSGSFTNTIDTTPAPPLAIGARGDNLFHHDGKIDEVVVFDDLLSDSEIDEIRAGTYGSGGSTLLPIFLNQHFKNLGVY